MLRLSANSSKRLRLRYVAERLDAVLAEATRHEPTYLDFLDQLLRQEVEAKQRKRIAVGVQIAHFPGVKTLEDFEFKFRPSIDQRLVRAPPAASSRRRRMCSLWATGRRQNALGDRAGARRRGDRRTSNRRLSLEGIQSVIGSSVVANSSG